MTSVHRRLPPEQRRLVIVEAAGRLFGERGHDGTRLDDVAPAARVTKPGLYRHVESHTYAWKMLFRDSGGGAEIAAYRRDVHARAREVLAGLIRALAKRPLPAREVAPLAELLSMGMASLVLWWIEDAAVSRDAVADAIARTWLGLLSSSAA